MMASNAQSTPGSTPASRHYQLTRHGRDYRMSTEHSISIVAGSAKDQLPKHLRTLPHGARSHDILIPALINGEPRLYYIGVSTTDCVYTRYVNEKAMHKPPRVALSGSGAEILRKDRSWQRGLLRLLAAYERNHINPRRVADSLAELNTKVAAMDRFVSQKCIVSWRRDGGGTHFYDGIKREKNSSEIPTVSNGMDVNAILRGGLPFIIQEINALMEGRKLQIDGKTIEHAVNREYKPPIRDLK